MEDVKKSTVVVVGGGVAGATLAKTLQFHADLVLVDPKEYFEIPWVEMRSKVEPSFADKSVINHRDYLTNGRLVISTAVSVNRNEVLTKDGTQIPYDYLVIATGHHDDVPRTRRDRLRQFQSENEKIKASKSVLIVGGGPSGVELAGEISVDYPDKKVTLVHRGSRLMEFIGPKAAKKSLNWLASKKVEVLLEQSLDVDSVSEEAGIFKTSAGESISADCHFTCIGKPIASSWLRQSFLEDSLDSRGRLKVDEHLRVKDQSNVFAIGDITDVAELKQGYLAQLHAGVVTNNLKILLAGGKESKMSSHKPASAMAIVSLGRKEAVAQFPFATISGCLPGLIKSKNLFVGKTRKSLGLDGSS